MTPHFFCDQCGQGYETRRQLVNHIPTHRNEVFACRQCEKKFISNTKLKNHVRENHSKENTCSLCGSRFGHLASLNNHVKEVHEKDKADPIACKFCNKTCHKRSLKRHEISCKSQTNRFAILQDETVAENDRNGDSQTWQSQIFNCDQLRQTPHICVPSYEP